MRRVLVPLDGSTRSAAVLDDARRLAGPQGELILMHLIPEQGRGRELDRRLLEQTVQAQQYLDTVADGLRAQGMSSSTLVLPTRNIPLAIDEAANATWADIIACATYRLDTDDAGLRGSIAWRALAHSPVPVLLRHPIAEQNQTIPVEHRHILVPLDGSELAESALPLALELASEWDALLTLVRVTHTATHGADRGEEEGLPASTYLSTLATSLPRPVQWRIAAGQTIRALLETITKEGITDIVMASHGRSGLSRVVLGSVAYDLVHHVAVPTIIIPASAQRASESPHAPARM